MDTGSSVYIIRHGQSLHNVDRAYAHRDPPLTETGHQTTKKIRLPLKPDLIIVSSMTRTLQTAINAFPDLISTTSTAGEVQVWPDLREAHDALCNKGVSRMELAEKFPQFDFRDCSEVWDYPSHSVDNATMRAESVRKRLEVLSGTYKHIAIVTHRGFIAFLVQGPRFDVCETRAYRFAQSGDEAQDVRFGVNVDTDQRQDFGPTILIPK